jgi:hypothetical protein
LLKIAINNVKGVYESFKHLKNRKSKNEQYFINYHKPIHGHTIYFDIISITIRFLNQGTKIHTLLTNNNLFSAADQRVSNYRNTSEHELNKGKQHPNTSENVFIQITFSST